MHFKTLAIAAICLPLIAACGGTNSTTAAGGATAAGTLPVNVNGKMIARQFASTVTSTNNQFGNTLTTPLQGVRSTDATAAGGVTLAGTAVTNPNGTDQNFVGQLGGAAAQRAALITATPGGNLAGGAVINPIANATGTVYFENGNYGDPQVTSTNAAISAVGVYNNFQNNVFQNQIALSDVTTIRYRSGNNGDNTAIYGVGFIGNATANMPGAAAPNATYNGFFEGGTSGYNDGGTIRNIFFRDATVQLTANFAAGTVTGGISGGTLNGATAANNNATLNNTITGLEINTNIAGNAFTGTAALVDNAGNTVGNVVSSEVLGGFFGDAAKNAAAGIFLEGTAALNGANRDYVISGVIGGVKQ